MLQRLLLVICLSTCSVSLFSQNSDTTIVVEKKKSPQKAILFSALCPGLGQIYNQKYWYVKVPVIYGGFAALGYGMYYYRGKYKPFSDAYVSYSQDTSSLKTDPIVNGEIYTIDQVKAGRDYYQRRFERFAVATASWYLLNILEAYVYANLNDFDVSDDLSMRISPSFIVSPTASSINPALSLRIRF